jgi:hypothetical protein
MDVVVQLTAMFGAVSHDDIAATAAASSSVVAF